jgi:hypothetical protein
MSSVIAADDAALTKGELSATGNADIARGNRIRAVKRTLTVLELIFFNAFLLLSILAYDSFTWQPYNSL